MANWKVKIEWETVINGSDSEENVRSFAIEELHEELGDYPHPNKKLKLTVERQK